MILEIERAGGTPAVLEIEGLTKRYVPPARTAAGPITVLDGLSLTVAAGEFVAVQGPSGCGKSTLLLLAGGLLRPDGGAVRIEGHDPYAMSPEARARFRAAHTGFVFQQFHLVPYLSVLDNVLCPALALRTPDARRRAEELIEHFGLAHRKDHEPAKLSTGERQRTALARALLNKPKLLLADEPTGNLDADNGAAVLGYLAEFAKAGGAVLLVTHDPRVATYASRVCRLGARKEGESPSAQ
ncbi:MAG: ABC transporter ATP-binding protein [Planctomycetota bacterium]|nr:ABC transporter ATP-binding protein [Planctomycetota bacterium]